MEPLTSSSTRSSRSSSQDSARRNAEPLLPIAHSSEKPARRLWLIRSGKLYERLFIWTLISLVLAGAFLFHKSTVGRYDIVAAQPDESAVPSTTSIEEIPRPTDSQGGGTKLDPPLLVVPDPDSQDHVESSKPDEGEKLDEPKLPAELSEEEQRLNRMPWLRFKHLDGYFNGLKTLVSLAKHDPEYPNITGEVPFPAPPKTKTVPKPKPYGHPYKDSDKKAKICYLDAKRKIPVPSMYAYDGVPQHLPEPALGSYEVLGLRNDVCFDRFGRYGPYGLGYSKLDGGLGIGMETENSGSSEVWAKSGRVNYTMIDWADVQDRCQAANAHRFRKIDPDTEELESGNKAKGKTGRTAVVVRAYTDFEWTELAVANFRALISELALRSGGEYVVHFLLHVRDTMVPVWSDEQTVQDLLDQYVPAEFHGLVSLWSEPQMLLYYPGDFEESPSNPSHSDIRGVYRAAHLPLQIFAMDHPEYEYFWNWELDMRYLGNYYELLDRMGKWADEQPRELLWERNERYYIPSHHKSWENFTQTVERNIEEANLTPIFGPVQFERRKDLRFEEAGQSAIPKSCDEGQDRSRCGVGEPADLVTLNPIFDTDGSGWVFGIDESGYGDNPPRRGAIITASRFSRRLLAAMHEEVWRHHHLMFSEMFPPSVCLHHALKAVYAPHPVYVDRAWAPAADGAALDAVFNGGRGRSTSGPGSPFDILREHNHKGTTWYYNSEFAGMLWRRWLGYAQADSRPDVASDAGSGVSRGGAGDEAAQDGSGRMCLRSVLLHPIKFEQPAEA